MNLNVAVVREVLNRQQNGVTYTPRDGGVCPCCRQSRCRIYRTLPWEENNRTRYHKCQNCGTRFKSIEDDSGRT